jgi:hypothetical protein
VDARRLCRDRLARIDQLLQRSGLIELAPPERHCADLNDAGFRGVETGRLGVNDEGIERD